MKPLDVISENNREEKKCWSIQVENSRYLTIMLVCLSQYRLRESFVNTRVFTIEEQMNLSKPDKGPEDYIKNVGEFHYEPSVGEIFTTWYARNRDVYENRMAGLAIETRTNMLLWKFSKNNNPDIMLHHPTDEYNNFRSVISDSNMVESNETQAYQIRKPEIDRSPENNPTPQP
ncbi:hypothetical protein ACTXT7_015242 [Hymenolepis weldensis]